jgi:hypothetical protein
MEGISLAEARKATWLCIYLLVMEHFCLGDEVRVYHLEAFGTPFDDGRFLEESDMAHEKSEIWLQGIFHSGRGSGRGALATTLPIDIIYITRAC